jgi:hypothetical protein
MSKIVRYRPLLMIGFALFPITIGPILQARPQFDHNLLGRSQDHWHICHRYYHTKNSANGAHPFARVSYGYCNSHMSFHAGSRNDMGAAIPLAVFNSKVSSLAAIQ